MKVKKTGKRVVSLFVSALILLSLVPLGAVTASAVTYLSGGGTKDNPYLISSAEEFMQFSQGIYDGEIKADSCVKLTNDIRFNTSTMFISGGFIGDTPKDYLPICCDSLNPYSGVFDGDGHTVSGVYYKDYQDSAAGLFGFTSGAEIKNLTIKDSYIEGYEKGDKYIGAIVGIAYNTEITNCHNINTCVRAVDKFGGIAGAILDNSVISDCSNSGTIYAMDEDSKLGGIVGYLENSTVSDTTNTGTIWQFQTRKNSAYGGIVGYAYKNCTIERCTNSGKLYFPSYAEYFGTILGSVNNFNKLVTDEYEVKLQDCISTAQGGYQLISEILLDKGTVTINNTVSEGRFVGKLADNIQNLKISNSYYTADTPINASAYEKFMAEGNAKVDSTQLKSGEVTYKLSKNTDDGVWGQTIGTDDYPVIHGKKVYYGYVNCLSTTAEYSNDFRYETIAEAHKYNEKGFCTVCGIYGGDPDKPFPISSADDLKAFAGAVNKGSCSLSARLTADIDLNPGTVFDGRGDFSGDTPSEWTSIANTSDNAYTGTFDGDGHTINGLYSTTGGLFGYLGNATIKNLKIENATVKTSGSSGLLANVSSGTALKIENCSVSGYVGGADSGGFIGQCGNVTFTDCNSSAYVSCSGYAGGFAGKLSGDYSFTRCSRDRRIISSKSASGGFIGCASGGVDNSFTDCYTTNSVDGYGTAGGFIGEARSYFIMKNCYKTGYIDTNVYYSQRTYAGAVAGYLYNNAVIDNFYYTLSGESENGLVGNPDEDPEDPEYEPPYIDVATCYYISDSQFASGEVTYKLNGSKSEGDLAWGQTIGTEKYPVLGGKTVYYGTNCSGTSVYSNEPVSSEHNFIYMNGKCSKCGAYEDGMSGLYGHSITLGGNIGVNFIMELDTACQNDNTTMEFALLDPATQEPLHSASVAFSKAKKVTVDGKGYFSFTFNVAAKEMTAAIKAQVKNGDKQGTEFYYNVAEYAYSLLGQSLGASGNTQKMLTLVKAMLNYGAYSQEYFNFNTDYPANIDLPEADKSLTDYQAADYEIYNMSCTQTGTDGAVTYYGSSLILNSNTEIKHYFTFDTSKTSIDGIACTDSEGTVYAINQCGDNSFCINIGDIAPDKLDKAITLTVSSGGVEQYTVSYSPLSYFYQVLKNYPTDDGTHNALRNVVKALYNYHQAANEYTA